MTDPFDPALRRRNRVLLLALVGIFIGSFVLAGVLRFSGWRPEGMRNKGELLQTPSDLRAVPVLLADGTRYAWNPVQRQWRILVAAPADCGQPCSTLGSQLDTVWQLFGKDADQVDVLWIGTPPDSARGIATLKPLRATPELLAGLPVAAATPADRTLPRVYVIAPNGFVILRDPAGFDPADLRSDVARLLKLR